MTGRREAGHLEQTNTPAHLKTLEYECSTEWRLPRDREIMTAIQAGGMRFSTRSTSIARAPEGTFRNSSNLRCRESRCSFNPKIIDAIDSEEQRETRNKREIARRVDLR